MSCSAHPRGKGWSKRLRYFLSDSVFSLSRVSIQWRIVANFASSIASFSFNNACLSALDQLKSSGSHCPAHIWEHIIFYRSPPLLFRYYEYIPKTIRCQVDVCTISLDSVSLRSGWQYQNEITKSKNSRSLRGNSMLRAYFLVALLCCPW